MPDHRGRSASIVRWLLRPRIIVPVFVSAAIIGALVAFADLGKLANLLAGLRPIYVVGAAVLILGYNAVQSVQWFYLLDHLGIVAPRRDALLAFAGGNLTKYLPGGSYFQNYLLNETSSADPALSSVATTLMVLLGSVGLASLAAGHRSSAGASFRRRPVRLHRVAGSAAMGHRSPSLRCAGRPGGPRPRRPQADCSSAHPRNNNGIDRGARAVRSWRCT